MKLVLFFLNDSEVILEWIREWSLWLNWLVWYIKKTFNRKTKLDYQNVPIVTSNIKLYINYFKLFYKFYW